MKEATGELNMTVVTIVAIAALMGFFYLIIWPNLKSSMALNTACNSAGSTMSTTQVTLYQSGTAGQEGFTQCTGIYQNGRSVVTCNYTNNNGNVVTRTCE